MRQCCFLVGARGCGKSTLAHAAASLFGWQAVDVDDLLVDRLGMPIGDYFTRYGEERFRDIEQEIMQDIVETGDRQIFGTGGGCVVRPATRELLRQSGFPVVYLQASPAVLQDRLRLHLGDRPSLTGADPVAEVPVILAKREPWYQEVASATVAVDRPVESVVADLVRIVENSSNID